MDKYINISNSLSVIVSQFNDNLMLELRGQFMPKRMSANKVSIVLANANMLAEIAKSGTDGFYPLNESESVIVSKFNGTGMIELRGEFRPQRFSVNVLNAILGHQKELYQIIQENTAQTVKAEQIQQATTELERNSASIGTDKKSAKDVESKVVVPASPVQFKGHATIQAYLESMGFNKVDADYYSTDTDAQKEYAQYLESTKKASFLDAKKNLVPARLSFNDAKKSNENLDKRDTQVNKAMKSKDNPASPELKAETAKLKTAAKKQLKKGNETLQAIQSSTNGIPVQYAVNVVNEKGIAQEQTFTADSYADAFDNQIVGKRLRRTTIKNGKTEHDDRLVVIRPENTTSAQHYFKDKVKQGFVYNVQELKA